MKLDRLLHVGMCSKTSNSMVSKTVGGTSVSHLYIFISISLLLSNVERADGRRSPKFIVSDPVKEVLSQEWDIFDVSVAPSSGPSSKPSQLPSFNPSQMASTSPSEMPTMTPSIHPTLKPSRSPSLIPSNEPSQPPTFIPSTRPSKSPTAFPSIHPSQLPSASPSIQPSDQPSSLPSLIPSNQPSLFHSNVPSNQPSRFHSNTPSLMPLTLSPTSIYPLGDVPDINDAASRAYFNYNPNDLNYGPGKPQKTIYRYNETEETTITTYIDEIVETTWMLKNVTNTTTNETSLVNTTKTRYRSKPVRTIQNKTIEKSFEYTEYQNNTWTNVRNSFEYQYWENFNMSRTLGNRCNSNPWRTQSPIDLCETHVNTKCSEHHQIRNRGGDYNLDDAEVELKILPSKLRIEYSRVNSQLDENVGLLPPHADFPLNWNGYISAVHIDIKIPSEHTICGKRYAGEYQVYFYHPKRRQPIVESVLIEIHPRDRPHLHFQKALNEWQAIFDLKQLECQNYERKLKREEEKFLRRIENYLGASVDSDKFTLIQEGDLRNYQSIPKDGAPVERDDEDDAFQRMVQSARKRVAHPKFEEVYDGVLENYTKNNPDDHSHSFSMREASETNVTMLECLQDDSNYTFILGDSNYTCCDLMHPDLSFGCKQERLLENCPRTCKDVAIGNTKNNNNNNNTAGTQSEPPSSSPSIKPRPRWNPFWPRIINSIHFYGYGGSLTEPPCSEWVAWRVLDTPMQISYEQWDQMRNIMFNQVDETCRRTSAHWRGSVARPTQSLNERALWKCTRHDYVSDVEKRSKEENDTSN